MSQLVDFSDGHENESNNERHNLIDPTTTMNLSLPGENFLRAATSLKDQVRT